MHTRHVYSLKEKCIDDSGYGTYRNRAYYLQRTPELTAKLLGSCPGSPRSSLLPCSIGQVNHRNYPSFQGKIHGFSLVIHEAVTHTEVAKELASDIVGDHQL